MQQGNVLIADERILNGPDGRFQAAEEVRRHVLEERQREHNHGRTEQPWRLVQDSWRSPVVPPHPRRKRTAEEFLPDI